MSGSGLATDVGRSTKSTWLQCGQLGDIGVGSFGDAPLSVTSDVKAVLEKAYIAPALQRWSPSSWFLGDFDVLQWYWEPRLTRRRSWRDSPRFCNVGDGLQDEVFGLLASPENQLVDESGPKDFSSKKKSPCVDQNFPKANIKTQGRLQDGREMALQPSWGTCSTQRIF